MREYSAGVGQTRSEFLPLTGRGVALDQGTRRPVASPRTSQQRLIHIQLPPQGHDDTRTLGPYGARLVVVGLLQDTTQREHIPPHIPATTPSPTTLAWNQPLGLHAPPPASRPR